MSINVQEAYRTPNEQDQKRNSSYYIIIKTLNVQNKERILKEAREKNQVIYKGRPTRLLSGDTEIQMIEQTTTAGKTINHNKCRKKNISQQKQINLRNSPLPMKT